MTEKQFNAVSYKMCQFINKKLKKDLNEKYEIEYKDMVDYVSKSISRVGFSWDNSDKPKANSRPKFGYGYLNSKYQIVTDGWGRVLPGLRCINKSKCLYEEV